MAFGDRRRGIGSHRIAEAAGLRIAARALPDLGLRQRRGVGERDRGQQDDERAHWDPSGWQGARRKQPWVRRTRPPGAALSAARA
jgi:hypothetical protein